MKNIMVLGFVVLFVSIIVIGCDRGTPPSPKTSEQPKVSTTPAPEPVKNPTPATSTETAKIKGFIAIGKNTQGYKEYRHDQTGLVFVLVPAGQFQMGSNDGESDEKPVHEVKIDSFLISKYEVTQGIWQKIMNNNPSIFKKGDNYPVEEVSWDDCDAFCKKTGLRLPTEAEWEYAARAGTNTKYYWGNEPDGNYMWYWDNSGKTTHLVGQRKPNGFGLYDILGNVSEWCSDWYGEDYYKEFSPSAKGGSASGGKDNPKGPTIGQYHVLRGGSWLNARYGCRSALRAWSVPYGCNGLYGFRCARDLR